MRSSVAINLMKSPQELVDERFKLDTILNVMNAVPIEDLLPEEKPSFWPFNSPWEVYQILLGTGAFIHSSEKYLTLLQLVTGRENQYRLSVFTNQRIVPNKRTLDPLVYYQEPIHTSNGVIKEKFIYFQEKASRYVVNRYNAFAEEYFAGFGNTQIVHQSFQEDNVKNDLKIILKNEGLEID